MNKVRYGWLLLPALAVALWVANASRPGIKAEGCPAGCVTAGERREGPLRLLSLNLLHDFPRFKALAGGWSWSPTRSAARMLTLSACKKCRG